MQSIKLEIAKLANTLGFKKYAENLWNVAELEFKETKFSKTDIESMVSFDGHLLSQRAEPARELIVNLADEQLYNRAQNYLDVFGFTVFRSVLEIDKVKKLDSILAGLKINVQDDKTIFSSPVEGSKDIQEILFNGSLFSKVSKVLGPFWYFGSDAAVNTKAFPLHRDTFFNPPVYKIFIPTQPAFFQVLCGSHYYNDEFSRRVGSYICNWDSPRNLSHGCPSIYFENIESEIRPVGFEDSQKNPSLTKIPLKAGDVFIFNQNLVHGLLPEKSDTTFIAMSAFPSPENSKKFNLSREGHLENIIKSATAITLVEKDLSSWKKVNPDEITFPGQLFDEETLEKLTQHSELREYFGLLKIPMHTWRLAVEKYAHLRWEILRDNL